MKKKLLLLATLCGLTISTSCFSQTPPRYLSEVFLAVNITTNVVYGNNISVLTGTPASIPLLMDVYEPAGDLLTARPLVIVYHSGSFLPAIANGLAVGSRKDSSVVYACMKFAKRGYVAVAMTSRLGWNALSASQDVRTGTLLNAVYRASQDMKNCVRFFRNDAANANVFKIDPTKIALGGMGSGGYIPITCASLNKPSELQLTKFIDFSQTPPVPYVNQALSGNFDGTDNTALNIANYPTLSSSVNVIFNISGAAGDSSWIEAGEVPIISMHAYRDPGTPYKTGNVIVASTGQFAVEASGSYVVTKRAQRLGNNAIFQTSAFNDVFTIKAAVNNEGSTGLFPFITPAPGPNQSCTGLNANPQTEWQAPFEWWNEAVFIASYNAYSNTSNGSILNCRIKLGNPNMSVAQGRAYGDTIQGFLNPRLVCAMNLAGCVSTVGIDKYSNPNNLNIFPNPVTSDINYAVSGSNTIRKVSIVDATGRLILSEEGMNTNTYKINREGLQAGLYFTTIELNNNDVLTKKIILE